ncbi:MAG: hypothetical protein KAR42_02700 [candidate division Zixibacteria bacterium]|nr:hypothetical protein [candidate division Zixibacteria bacterium]
MFSGLLLSGSVYAQPVDSINSQVGQYLGLALPYHKRDVIELDLKKSEGLKSRTVQILLQVDKKGKVKDISYNADSAAYIKPIQKHLKKLKFKFLDGMPISFPQKIPVIIKYKPIFKSGKKVTLDFPVNFNVETDNYESNRFLLALYFEHNNIAPPEVVALPPLSYPADVHEKSGRYLTISAKIKLSKTGELEDIQFPLENMKTGTHQVFTALLNASFEPFLINNEPRPCEFFLTFRIFDNLKYPYLPKIDVKNDSTAFHSELYFVTSYFNSGDISIFALPREFPELVIPASGLSVEVYGEGLAEVVIDEDGRITGISTLRATGNMGGYIRDIMLRLNFYPAVNSRGEPIAFFGRIRLGIDYMNKVVYFPEWLGP